MKRLINLLLLSVCFVSAGANAHAKATTLTASDGFKLKTSYFAGQANKPGVLMLHQCNADRSMYDALGKLLAAQGIHALSLDFRMYGESVTDTVDLKKMRIAEPERDQRMVTFRKHSKHWPDDVALAKQYLRDKIGAGAMLGVVGASCGGGQAIVLAGSHKVDALMFFSSGMNEKTLNKYQQLKTTPTFIVAAEEDTFTFDSAQQLFKLSGHPQNRLLNYKGAGHGHPLFKQDPSLAGNMVAWLSKQLAVK